MRTFLILLLFFAVSCGRHASSDTKIELLADRTCRAIHIRQQRFALADQIRFVQDTLFNIKNKNDTIRLRNSLDDLLRQKNILLKESLALADTIRAQLDSIMPYTNKAAQQHFTAKLDSLLAKKGCRITHSD